MPSRWGARTTICIATLDRPQFVARTLRYYRDTGFAGVILLGDGSAGAALAATREACATVPEGFRVDLIELPGVPLQKVFGLLAERVDTEFAVISGDDDYFIAEGIEAAEARLTADAGVIAAHGMAIVVHMNDVRGVPFKGNRYPLPTLEQDSALARLQAFFANYAVSLFCLHRAEAWKRMWALAGDLADRTFGTEIAACAMSVALGKCVDSGNLYLIRQVHSSHYPLPPGRAWMLTPDFAASGDTVIGALADVLGEHELRDWSGEAVRTTVWNAFMQYLCHGFGGCGAPDVRRMRDESDRASLHRLLDREGEHAAQFWPVLASMVGEDVLHGNKPHLLIAWGNPYVMEETIGPLLPELSQRFTILLMIVDFRLTPEIRGLAQGWKDRGWVVDVLTVPNHGWQFAAHQYMYDAIPMLRVLDFDLLVTISAMQPYERYLLECSLPERCLRIVLWPHPTFMAGNHPELAARVRQRAPAREIAAVARRLTRPIAPAPLRELLRQASAEQVFRVLACLGVGALRNRFRPPAAIAFGPLFPRQPSRPSPVQAPAAETPEPPARPPAAVAAARAVVPSPAAVAPAQAAPPLSTSAGMMRRLARSARLRNLWHLFNRWFPTFAGLVRRQIARGPTGRQASGHGTGALPRHRLWPHDWLLNQVPVLERVCPALADRYLFPQFLVGRWFALRRYDFVTQLGTDLFDAVAFFNEADAREHAVLYGNANMYAVRYPTRRGASENRVNAVLMPFSLHSKEDVDLRLCDLYARDLGIALRESGAAEVHLRPHPGRTEPWLAELVEAIVRRGVPCRLVPADRPLTHAAAEYRGVVGAVSGSLRDAYLACPDIFVVGSMALSLPGIPDPKATIGFPGGIGWIEADGSYAPEIFSPASRRDRSLPSIVELIDQLRAGRWQEVPPRLRERH